MMYDSSSSDEEARDDSQIQVACEELLKDERLDSKSRLILLNKLKSLNKAKSEMIEQELENAYSSSENSSYYDESEDEPEPASQRNETKNIESDESSNEGEEEKSNRHIESTKRQSPAYNTTPTIRDTKTSNNFKKAATLFKQKSVNNNEKFMWKQSNAQLKHRIKLCDRDRKTALNSILAALKDESVDRYSIELERQREKTKRDLSTKLDKAKWAVSRLKQHINDVGTGEQYILQLQRLMQAAEAEIATFKHSEHRKYDELLREEEIASREIEQLAAYFKQDEDHRTVRGSKSTSTLKKLQPTKRAAKSKSQAPREMNNVTRQKNISLLNEINEIDEELADIGGADGTWDKRDHKVFLEVVSRFKLGESFLCDIAIGKVDIDSNDKIRKFITKVSNDIPTKSMDDCRNHLEFYARYTHLLKRKKKLVKDWRSTVQAKQENKIKELINKEAQLPLSSTSPTNSTPRSNKTSRSQQEKQKAVELDRKRKKAQVQAWKEEKAEKMRLEEQKKIEQQQIQQKKLEADKRRMLERRNQLSLYKLKKEAASIQQQQMSKAMNSARSLGSRSSSDLNRFRERDAKIVEEKKRLKEQAKARENARDIRLQQLLKSTQKQRQQQNASKASTRDPDRLFRPTVASQSQQVTTDELEQLAKNRHTAGAHDRVVPSTSGVSKHSKGYGIGLVSNVSGRAATWHSRGT